MADTAFTDSYITLKSIFTTMVTGDPRVATIALAAEQDATIAWYLKKATAKIDSKNYAGYMLEDNQARQFPRKYLYNPDRLHPWGLINYQIDAWGFAYLATTPPDDILKACLEEAIAMYAEENDADQSLRSTLQRNGVISVGFRGRSETFKPGARNRRDGFLSEEAYDIIVQYRERAVSIV
jgi:hypothetical protein